MARLPISLVFTANFDDLLERAFRDAGKRVEVVVKDSSIPFMRRGPDVVNIVKLYGDLDQPDTIVLARQQYESYFLQRPQMVKLLETELARSDTLYLGWSGSDPYFKLVFGELLSRFGADDARGLCGHVRRERRPAGRAGAQADPAGGVTGRRPDRGSWPRGWRAWPAGPPDPIYSRVSGASSAQAGQVSAACPSRPTP